MFFVKNLNGIILSLNDKKNPKIYNDRYFKIYLKLCGKLKKNLKDCYHKPSLAKQNKLKELLKEEKELDARGDIVELFFCEVTKQSYNVVVYRRNCYSSQCTLKYITKNKTYNVVDYLYKFDNV